MRILLRDLSPGTAYQIQLRATDDNGNSSEWSRLFQLTTSADVVAPNTPTGVTGTQSGSSFQLVWAAVTTSADGTPAHDLDRYEVKVESAGTGTTGVYSVKGTTFLFDINMNRQLFGSPRANVKMSVRAVDTIGNASAYSSISDQTNAAPANPTNFTAIPGLDSIVLKWDAVTDADLLYYKIYSGTVAGTQTTLVWQGSTTGATITSLLYSSDRWYKVAAVDIFGTESVTPPVAGPVRPNSPFSLDSTAPGVPAGLAATLTNATDGKTAQAVVTWTAVTDTDGDLASYILGYKPSATADWQYTTIDYTQTGTTLLGLTPYVNYDFKIRSSDFFSNLSAWSSTLTKTATANAAPAAPTGLSATFGKEGITAKWTENSELDVANGAGVYEVDIATNVGFTTGLLTYRTGATSIAITGLAQSQAYWVRVRAVDSLGLSSSNSTAINGTTGALNNFKYTTGPSAPGSPSTGDIWMDTTTGFEKQWSGSAWVNTGNASLQYINARGTDLVTNGNGTMGNNYNFSAYDYNGADAPTGAQGSFVIKTTTQQSAFINEFIPFDPTKDYKFSFQCRQTVAAQTNTMYGFIAPYDAFGNGISPSTYMYTANTTTTLAAPLNNGDTTITLTSSANWYGSAAKPAGASTHLRGVIIWDYVDPGGKAWPVESYSRNAYLNLWADGGITGNVITLSAPWSGGNKASGTPLSNSSSGGSYMYMPSASNVVVPQTWTTYSDVFSAGVMTSNGGVATWGTGVPPGTAKILVGWLMNYPAGGTGKHAIAAVSFSDAAAAQSTADTALVSANGKNKIVHSLSAASSPSSYATNDIWIQYDGSNQIIGQWRLTAGAWVSEQISSAFIANLDAGKLTANSAFVTTLNIGAGGVIQSAGYTGGGTSGFQLSTSGLTIKGTGNAVAVESVQAGTITAKTINIGATGVLNIDSTGQVKSNNYSAGSTGYKLSNTGLEINDGDIDAKNLRTNTAIIGDLTIGRSADALGTIKSFDYSAGAAGWKIGKGLFEINNGLIKAGALQLQNSPNLIPAAYADFEYTKAYYIDPFWLAGGQAGMSATNAIVETFTTPSASLFKGKQFISIGQPFNTSALSVFFGASATDYNVSVEPGKTYIWSMYMRNPQATAETYSIKFKGDNGTTFQTTPFALGASEAALVRRTVAVTIPAGVNKILISVDAAGTTNTKALHIDCQQFEEKTGTDNTPSVWKPPGATTLDGYGITTGQIVSQTSLVVGGVTQPTWSINTQGAAQFGDALIRGKLIVGATNEDYPNRAPGNGDFETNVTGYSVYQTGATGTAIARTTTGGEVITGTGSAKVTAAAGAKTSLGMAFNTAMNYLPGTTIRIQGNVKVNTTDAASTIACFLWNAALGAVTSATLVPSPVANTVYSFDYSYTVQPTEDVATVIFSHQGGTATSVIFDDIWVTVDNEIGPSFVSSANYQQGDTGWMIDGQGNVEFNSGYFRGQLGAGIVTAESLSATITMSSTFRTAESGKRVEFNSDGIIGYRTDGTSRVNIPTDDTLAASFEGDLLATSLTISDSLAIRGLNNELSRGSVLTLQSGTTAPNSPPTVTIDWKVIPTKGDPAWDPYRYGIAVQGGWFRIPIQIYGIGTVVESYNKTTGAKQYGSLATNANDGAWTSDGGCTAIGNNFYILGTTKAGVWSIFGYTFGTGVSGAPTRFLKVGYSQSVSHRKPTIGNDGTNLLVAFNDTASSIVQVRTYNATTGAQIGGAALTNLTAASDMASINKGVFDDGFGQSGGTCLVVTSRNSTTAYVLNNSLQRMSQYDFPLIAKPAGQCWDSVNGKFYTHDAVGGRIQEHTAVSWNASTAGLGTWYATNTWYNTDATNGNKETSMGPIQTFAMKQRARVTITTAAIPIRPIPNTVDDATAVGIYLARNTSLPGRTLLERIAYLADGVRSTTIETITIPLPGVAASQPPPAVSNYPASSPAVIRSDNDKFVLNGDGSGAWGDMTLASGGTTILHGARPFNFTLTASWVNFAAGFASVKFYRTADGTWIGTGLAKVGTSVSVTAAGVQIGTISSYPGTTSQISSSVSCSTAGYFSLEVRSGGGVFIRTNSGGTIVLAVGQWVSLNGAVYHEAAA